MPAYLGTGDGTLAAIETTTGHERWRTTLSPSGGAANVPAYADGLVFVGTARDGFFAVDSASGAIRWKVDTASDVTGTPAVASGVAYIGAGSDAKTGHSWAIDVATGRVIWRIDEPFGAPAIANGIGYSGSNPGAVTARELATGKELWRTTLQGVVRAPAVAQGIVYLPADGEHRVYALDATTGGRLWRFDVDGSNSSCIAVAKGSVFVGTSPGTVYSIGGDGSTVTPVLPDATASGVAPAARSPEPASASPSPDLGPVLARFRDATTLPGDHVIPNDLVQDPSGRIWVAAAYDGRFAVLDRQGRFIEYWGKPGGGPGEFDFIRSNGDAYGGIAFAPDGSFFVLEAGNRRVQKFDRNRRFVKSWGGFGTGPGNYSDPVDIGVGPDGNVYVLDDIRGVVEKYDTNGNVLGQIAVFSNTSPGFNKSNAFAIDQRGNLYISQIDPNQVAEFDPKGTLIRVFGKSGPGALREQPGGLAIDSAGRLIVDQGPERDGSYGVEVFDDDGTYLGGWGPPGTGGDEITFPTALMLDGEGGVFVGEADWGAAGTPRILRFRALASTGPVATLPIEDREEWLAAAKGQA